MEMEYELILDKAAKVAYEKGIDKLEVGSKAWETAVDSFVKIEETKAKFKKINQDGFYEEMRIESDKEIQTKKIEMEKDIQNLRLAVEILELELKIAQIEANNKKTWWMPEPDTMLVCGTLTGVTAVSYIAEILGIMSPKALRGVGVDKLIRFVHR